MATQKPGQEPGTEQKEELAAYEKLRIEVKKILDQSIDAVSADKIAHAVEHAEKLMKETGEHTQEQVSRLGRNLRKDMLGAFKAAEPPVKELSDTVGGLFDLWRDKGGVILTDLAAAIGDWSHQFSHKLDEMLRYQSGDMTHGGTFICLACGQTLTLKKPSHLPPCPKCHKTEFRRA